ncbi:glucan endo-1,3-beta-glucosidase 4-like [Spinacia oleracea]|uniref:Glucan endo-1,3-beta-glucosidase 4-like n=1 Tax=Spinacia oleracea TaxID=3562 RepID=A0ABM3QNQ1_SPIOL|nr:glucan endo-1,3-beta-glucosidase 4-like [Spinacia oleracea]
MKTYGWRFSLGCLLLLILANISGGYSECTDWCVARSEASDAVIQKSLDWVCNYGPIACTRIQPGQPCYRPNDLRGVASAAFNDYWQLVKHSPGALCDIFGAASLVHQDPSHDNCPFSCKP